MTGLEALRVIRNLLKGEPATDMEADMAFAALAKEPTAYAVAAAKSLRADRATPEQTKRALALYGSDDVAIDDNATISETDGGVWVSAWLWLENEATQ